MRTTTQCAGCQAPVSVGEPVCWSCGDALPRAPAVRPPSAAPPAARKPVPLGPFSHPCPACGEVIALYHRTCPNCGTHGTPPNVPLEPPKGWTEQLLPDGAIRLSRTRDGRVQNVLLPLIVAGAMLVGTLGRLLDPPRRGLLPPDAELVVGIATGVVGLCLTAVVGVCLAWLWAGRESWTIRQGLLEIRRECLWWKWFRGYSAAEVALVPDYGWASHRHVTWKLLARGTGPDQLIASTTYVGFRELSALGAYLAARTGWKWHPCQDPSPLMALFGPRPW